MTPRQRLIAYHVLVFVSGLVIGQCLRRMDPPVGVWIGVIAGWAALILQIGVQDNDL